MPDGMNIYASWKGMDRRRSARAILELPAQSASCSAADARTRLVADRARRNRPAGFGSIGEAANEIEQGPDTAESESDHDIRNRGNAALAGVVAHPDQNENQRDRQIEEGGEAGKIRQDHAEEADIAVQVN